VEYADKYPKREKRALKTRSGTTQTPTNQLLIKTLQGITSLKRLHYEEEKCQTAKLQKGI
jgi:hypothetical protein